MSYEFAIRQGTRRESLTHNSKLTTHNSHSYSQLTIQNLKTQKLKNDMKNVNWKQVLKMLIAVLTAIAGSIGVVSCMS